MNQEQINSFKNAIESALRNQLITTLVKIQDKPEMLHGILIMNTAKIFCDNLKKKYSAFIESSNSQGVKIDLSEREYFNIIEGINIKVLDEFINPPPTDNED